MPIYEALLERDLRRRGIVTEKKEPMVVEMEVEESAPFVGQAVRTLGSRARCVLVRCDLDGCEWVPMATTILKAHTRITAVITPEAGDALAILRRGCSASAA